jgi:hypothetical protein
MQDEEKEKLFLYVLVGETCQKESRERGKEGGEKKGKSIVTTAWVNYMSLPQERISFLLLLLVLPASFSSSQLSLFSCWWQRHFPLAALHFSLAALHSSLAALLNTSLSEWLAVTA